MVYAEAVADKLIAKDNDIGSGALTFFSKEWSGTARKVWRALDILLASIGVVLFAPLMLLVGLLVRFSSPGGMLFRQEDDDTLTDLRVDHAYSDFNGLSRKNRVRYDSPKFHGAHLAGSLFSLDEIALEPRLLAPFPNLPPGGVGDKEAPHLPIRDVRLRYAWREEQRRLSPVCERVLAAVEQSFPLVTEDRVMADDLQHLAARVDSGEILAVVEQELPLVD